MKNICTQYICTIVLIFAIYQPINSQDIPFSTNKTNLTIWNGTDYIPFFINGTNLGVAVPGTFPGELAASRKQYGDWFKGIKDVFARRRYNTFSVRIFSKDNKLFSNTLCYTSL